MFSIAVFFFFLVLGLISSFLSLFVSLASRTERRSSSSTQKGSGALTHRTINSVNFSSLVTSVSSSSSSSSSSSPPQHAYV